MKTFTYFFRTLYYRDDAKNWMGRHVHRRRVLAQTKEYATAQSAYQTDLEKISTYATLLDATTYGDADTRVVIPRTQEWAKSVRDSSAVVVVLQRDGTQRA